MEKITITPQMVRGLGDIVNSKSATDFTKQYSTLTETTDTVHGTTTKIFQQNSSILLRDGATTTDHNDIWNNMDWFTRADDGTSVYYQNTGSSTVQRKLSSNLSINGEDVAIDLELINSTYCLFQVERRATGSSSQYNNRSYHNTSGNVHIEILSTGTYYYLNGTLVSSETTQLNQEEINFYVLTQRSQTSNFKYKDLRIYYL